MGERGQEGTRDACVCEMSKVFEPAQIAVFSDTVAPVADGASGFPVAVSSTTLCLDESAALTPLSRVGIPSWFFSSVPVE